MLTAAAPSQRSAARDQGPGPAYVDERYCPIDCTPLQHSTTTPRSCRPPSHAQTLPSLPAPSSHPPPPHQRYCPLRVFVRPPLPADCQSDPSVPPDTSLQLCSRHHTRARLGSLISNFHLLTGRPEELCILLLTAIRVWLKTCSPGFSVLAQELHSNSTLGRPFPTGNQLLLVAGQHIPILSGPLAQR